MVSREHLQHYQGIVKLSGVHEAFPRHCQTFGRVRGPPTALSNLRACMRPSRGTPKPAATKKHHVSEASMLRIIVIYANQKLDFVREISCYPRGTWNSFQKICHSDLKIDKLFTKRELLREIEMQQNNITQEQCTTHATRTVYGDGWRTGNDRQTTNDDEPLYFENWREGFNF